MPPPKYGFNSTLNFFKIWLNVSNCVSWVVISLLGALSNNSEKLRNKMRRPSFLILEQLESLEISKPLDISLGAIIGVIVTILIYSF